MAKRKPKTKATEPKKPHGRPTLYTPEVATAICERLAKGESLRSICRDEAMPQESTVRAWAIDNVGGETDKESGFYAQYARARDIALDTMADEIIEIADKPAIGVKRKLGPNGQTLETTAMDVVDRSRLRVDSRKWYLSKLAPKRYGEKITQEHTGANGGPIETSDVSRDEADRALLKRNGIKI